MKIGVVGAGQLGRMLGIAGIPLGIECLFLDTSAQAPAAAVGPVILGNLDDARKLEELARAVDVLTPEIENVSVEALRSVATHTQVHPPAEILEAAQDRLKEKRLFAELGIPTADFVPVDDGRALPHAAETLGWPIVLKSRRLGYDGRGQRVCASAEELQAAWRSLNAVPSIAESFVDFAQEVSATGVRGAGGEESFYPLSENVHADGILARTIAPYDDDELFARAKGWLASLMQRFDYRGVLTVEFFHTASGLIANEMAPRVHNSAHWTIEGAETSQFENHLRAVAGLPLGDTTPRGYAGMRNIIGEFPDRAALLRIPGLHLHDYGKRSRRGRKLGHCTLVDADRDRLLRRLDSLDPVLKGAQL